MQAGLDESLLDAVHGNRLNDVRTALDNGANINIIIDNGSTTYTPLVLAIVNGFPDIARELIIRGANRNILVGTVSSKGRAINYANDAAIEDRRFEEIVALLRPPSVNLNSKAKNQAIRNVYETFTGRNSTPGEGPANIIRGFAGIRVPKGAEGGYSRRKTRRRKTRRKHRSPSLGNALKKANTHKKRKLRK
jgi:hypothetical protein